MKTKQNIDLKFLGIEKMTTKTKPKSLRPMRSMVAVRSCKPKTNVATLLAKPEQVMERH